ncbi:hypothetical protein QNH98_04030 [Myroides sp. mNGS23_01]|nr:hypothetical protein [Myroides sp. mNGS23_01]WHT39853.1 hypothetical protein QNH98_04030 [Myroides sp. mNGS23_01]
MSKNIFLALLLLPMVTIAQTVIEGKNPSTSSVVLEFPSGTAKGIILPAVENLPLTPANGTFLYDKMQRKVRMFQNNSWVDLSSVGNASRIVAYNSTITLPNKQTIIGSHTTKVYNGSSFVDGAVDGIVVLEGSTKALVLPKIMNPHLTVKSPYPGMMCYDSNRKALAVFDGVLWNYWK